MTYDEIVALKKQHLQQLADYHKELCRKPRLKEFFIEMTQRCNEYCAHCGSRCGDVISEDLPKEVIFSVLVRSSVSGLVLAGKLPLHLI